MKSAVGAGLTRVFLLAALAVGTAVATDIDEEEIATTISKPLSADESADAQPLTCSSTVRIQNVHMNFFLHSHELNYGSGSGQQIVTGFGDDNDYNSLWTFKYPDMGNEELTADKDCLSGQKIKCGQLVRLEHMNTKRNLHSHAAFNGPVSGRQEVSGYGEQGDGDTGDNWIVECHANDVDGYLYAKTQFYLRHKDTDKYLYTDSGSKYNNQNCRRCPIIGQAETSGSRSKNKHCLWKVHSGFFIPDRQENSSEGASGADFDPREDL